MAFHKHNPKKRDGVIKCLYYGSLSKYSNGINLIQIPVSLLACCSMMVAVLTVEYESKADFQLIKIKYNVML